MNVQFTEEQEMLRASARDFLEKECDENVIGTVEAGGLGYSPDLWRKITDLGWLGLVFPEQYGGSGMNLVDLAVLYEEFGRAMFPSPYMSTVVLGGMMVLEAGSDEQKSEILPEIIEGNEIIVLALGKSESNRERTNLKPDNISVTATADGEDYLLEGVERFIYHATIATKFLVPAKTGNSSNPEENISLFLVDAGSPGIVTTRLATISADNQCEVIFEKVRVPAGNIIGGLNGGWTPLERSLQIESVVLASQMLGAGEHMLQASQEDFDTRLESGIDDDIKKYNEDYLAGLQRDIDDCRLAVYQAADKLAGGESIDFEASIVKSWTEYAKQSA